MKCQASRPRPWSPGARSTFERTRIVGRSSGTPRGQLAVSAPASIAHSTTITGRPQQRRPARDGTPSALNLVTAGPQTSRVLHHNPHPAKLEFGLDNIASGSRLRRDDRPFGSELTWLKRVDLPAFGGPRITTRNPSRQAFASAGGFAEGPRIGRDILPDAPPTRRLEHATPVHLIVKRCLESRRGA